MHLVPTQKIWKNGALIPWDQAVTHVATHSLHYGSGIYEGIRAYKTADGPAMFRLTDHMKRFQRSAKIINMALPYDLNTLVAACKETVRSTGLESCYVRPLGFFGYGYMSPTTHQCPVDVAIICWPWEEIEGFSDPTAGLKLKVSSWQRHDHNTLPPMAKTTGGYVTGSLAKAEALNGGYSDAILLNRHGHIAECTTENIFVVRNGIIFTPPHSAGALEGLTQDTVRAIANDLNYEVRVSELTRTDLYVADEIFVCGTASEVTAVASVDDRDVPCVGPITKLVSEAYHRIVRGEDERYLGWVEHANE